MELDFLAIIGQHWLSLDIIGQDLLYLGQNWISLDGNGKYWTIWDPLL